MITLTAMLVSARAQTATRLDTVRKTKPASSSSLPPEASRRLAEQLAESVDAGDSYATPGGRRRLRRLPGVVAVEQSPQTSRAMETLTRQDGPLARYAVETQVGRGRFSLLTAPSESRSRKRRQPDADLAALKQARQARPGVSLNPVFIEPKSGLRLIATDQLIVCLKAGANAQQHFGAAWKQVRPLWGTTDQFVLSLPGAAAEQIFTEVDRQSALGDVAWAEPDWISQAIRTSTPNDSYFNQQWHLENTGQGHGKPGADARLPAAWDQTTGTSSTVIAIVDDGVQLNHPDLSANIFVNTAEVADNGFDDDANGLVDDRQGYNFVVNLPDASPYSVVDNHGTAVAGLAAATGNNNLGTAGVAYNCRILPIKVLEGDYSATTSDFAKALRHVAGLNGSGTRVWRGADVVNISLTFGQSIVTDAALADVVTKGRNGRGAAIFVAAGNYAAAWEPVEYNVPSDGTYT
ncbi:MAG TPA: S8 family serine peptidase, partial [Verrucomicrobiae bacterium]|nr:S8 family serine peptidase [Verrucomicrobiae bacterium]